MDGLIQMLQDLAAKFPIAAMVLGILGIIVIVAQAVVLITPSKRDDELLEKIEKHSIGGAVIKLLLAFAPFKKK